MCNIPGQDHLDTGYTLCYVAGDIISYPVYDLSSDWLVQIKTLSQYPLIQFRAYIKECRV